jgi:branched-chain amino acid transport system ATP-binding protein
MTEQLLEVKNLSKHFGGLKAVQNLTFGIPRNLTTSIIGPNGAGKTTIFNLITGYYWPTSGEILFEGHSLAKRFPYQVASLGVARTFQTASFFSERSVEYNLLIASHLREKAKLYHILGRRPLFHREENEIREKAAEMIGFLEISSYRDQLAKRIPTAIKQLLSIGMALMMKPRLLLLDEPSGGMTVEEVEQLMRVIAKIKDQGITVALIEHRMRMVMGISDHIIVLNFGEKIAEGTPDAIRKDRAVIEAYLGKEYAI